MEYPSGVAEGEFPARQDERCVQEDYDRLNISGERGQPMKEKTVPEIENRLEGTRAASEEWRRGRKKRERIPEALWEAA